MNKKIIDGLSFEETRQVMISLWHAIDALTEQEFKTLPRDKWHKLEFAFNICTDESIYIRGPALMTLKD